MTLDQLLILTRIADTGSVLAAADSLHRTQPTVSVALRKLEGELDVELLDRSAYRARLTPAGEQLCQKARAVLAAAEDFKTLAHYLSIGHEAELKLAIEASCPMDLVLQILKASEHKYPQTEFSLQVENIWGALDKLMAGEVDLAISPWFREIQNLEAVSLVKTRLLTVATAECCPLEGELDLETMKKYVQIVVRDSGREVNNSVYGVLNDGRNWEVSDHATKKALIVAGMGWGRLQDHLIADELASGELKVLNIKNYPCDTEIDIRAVRRYGQTCGPVAEALWQDLNELSQCVWNPQAAAR